MNNKKGQFECFINEYEKINVIVEYNLKNNLINITNVGIKDDALVLLSDLDKNMQLYLLEEAKNYLTNITNNNTSLNEDIDNGIVCSLCLSLLKPKETIYNKSKVKCKMPNNGPFFSTVICESCYTKC